MSFERLLGNGQLKENLTGSLGKGHISHFYLISGPEGSGKHTLASLLTAAIFCREADRPCTRCENCRKALSGTHPDVIMVDDPEKKTVPVDLIRQARSDVYVRPNQSDHKIYCIPRADCLGVPGQNALLKILEEPPEYGVFLLLTSNPDKLLPTVRSRCTELKLQALPEKLLRDTLRQQYPKAEEEAIRAAAMRCGGYLGQAMKLLEQKDSLPPQTSEFVRCFSEGDGAGLAMLLAPMEKLKRDTLIPLLQSWLELVTEAMADRCGQSAVSPLAVRLSRGRTLQELNRAAQTLRKVLEYARGNVSPAAVCGYLCWQLQ